MLLPAQAQTVKLRASFVDSLRDRVTFTGNFDVFKYTGKSSEDGDAHGVVSNGSIGLPCVAELMNRSLHPGASKRIKTAMEKDDSIRLVGAWRMWWEHSGKGDQKQGGIYNLETANEAHVFELHPLLEIDTHKVYVSFIPKGYHQPAKAFAAYKKRQCTLMREKEYISITTIKTPYNYVQVSIVKPKPGSIDTLADGLRIRTAIRDSAGKEISTEETIVIMNGTPAMNKLRSLKKGEAMKAVVMPRLSFSKAWKQLEKVDEGKAIIVPIPYEFIVTGVIE